MDHTTIPSPPDEGVLVTSSAQGAAPPPAAPPPPGATVPGPPPGGSRPKPNGPIVAGVALVVVGLVVLLGRFIPGFAWWSLWPLAIVIAGLIQAFTPGKEGWSVHRMFDGFVTVAIGLVFLAITAGVVGWGVWATIFSLWPVLLIAIGFDLLGKSLHTNWLRVLGSVAIILALAWSVLSASADFGPAFMGPRPAVSDVSVSAPVGSASSASLTLEAGVAQVRVSDGDDLVSIDGTSGWGEPTLDVDRSGSQADVTARLGGPDRPHMMWPDAPSARFDVGLSDQVVWDVRVNTGVSSLRADLSDVPVRSFDLRPGVADCDVRLGEVPTGEREARAEVRAGVSSVTLRLPRSAEARVEIDSGLTGTSVRGRLESLGSGVWETPGYSEARDADRPVWLVRVRSGLGAITIDTY